MTAGNQLVRDFLGSSLGRRFLAILVGSLTVSSLAFLVIFVMLFRAQLIREHERASIQANELLQAALENAMVKRDIPGLRAIVSGLANQADIARIMILAPSGEIRFSTDSTLVGTQFSAETDVQRAVPALGAQALARYTVDETGAEVVRTINQVRNQPRCASCHGSPSEQPINGTLVVDYDASDIEARAYTGAIAMLGSGVIVLLGALSALGPAFYILVLKPVRQLSEATEFFARGDLSRRVKGSGSDEVSVLGERFNAMAGRIESMVADINASRAFLQSVIDAVPDGIRVIAPDYTVLIVNKAYCAQQGEMTEEAVGHPCYVSSHREEAPCSAKLVTCPLVELGGTGRESLRSLHRHVRKDGSELFVEVSAAKATFLRDGVAVHCIIESIRDLGQQAEASHKYRLAELGQLATGVAHEIHNPLWSIHLALSAIREDLRTDTSLRQIEGFIEIADKEVERCLAITDRLMKIAEPASEQIAILNVSEAVDATIRLVRFEAREAKVEIALNIPKHLRVVANESDMGIIILNLVQNAIHAMPTGGTLKVRGQSDGSVITLEFEDSGVGIAPEDHVRIFWPFWSRRGDGVPGTGLGLSIVQAIVKRLGGDISLRSRPGFGTTFTLHFLDADEVRKPA